MPAYRVADAAALLGVSDDTVRRWIDDGTLPGEHDGSGRRVVDGAILASRAQKMAQAHQPASSSGVGHRSARNSFTGLVVGLQVDGVMAQVDLQCGPYRVVSLVSAESVRELGLQVGSLTTAVVKATNVGLEIGPLA